MAFLEKRKPEFTGQVRAAVLHETGKPLSVEDVPEPEAGEGQSIVDVKAAGINFADVLIKNGHYPQPPTLPTVLGNEVARRDRRAAGRRVRAADRRRLCRAGRGRRRVGLRPAGRGELRRGRCVPDHVPDRVDPADPVGAPPPRLERARDGSGRRRRHGGDPDRRLRRRERDRRGGLGGEAPARARPRRAANRLVRGDRRARRHRRRARPRRRAGVRRLHQVAAAARRRDRDRLRRRRLGAGRPGPAGRTQHRRARLLPRPADGLRGRLWSGARSTSCSRSGAAARSSRSSAPSSRSSRRTRRST